MNIHWLIKYYFVGFAFIFFAVYLIEKSEPDVNWLLYPNITESEVKSLVRQKNCDKLNMLYSYEYNSSYEKNFFGFVIRKDKKIEKGKNLLKYLRYHLEQNNCN